MRTYWFFVEHDTSLDLLSFAIKLGGNDKSFSAHKAMVLYYKNPHNTYYRQLTIAFFEKFEQIFISRGDSYSIFALAWYETIFRDESRGVKILKKYYKTNFLCAMVLADYYESKKQYKEAIKIYEMISEKHSKQAPAALYRLGEIYRHSKDGKGKGRGERARACFRVAASANHSLSMFKLAQYWLKDANIMWFIELLPAVNSITKLKNLNSMPGYNTIIKKRLDQNVGKIDKGLEWMKRAARCGHSMANHYVAILSYSGFLLMKSNKNAKIYLKRASMNGHRESMIFLGDILLEENDKKRALSFYKQAHNLGSIKATYSLAKFYEKQEPTFYNKRLLVYYLEKADKANYPRASYDLAKIYLKDNKKELALEKLRKAASNNSKRAVLELALINSEGGLIEKNSFAAYTRIQKAASLGDANVLLKLGNKARYGNKDKEKVDYELAKKYYKRAAFYGNAEAMYQLGMMAFEGVGYIKNIILAKKWFVDAAKLNHKLAKAKLKNFVGNK